MVSPVVNQTNIVAPRVPLVDERTGLISREWYRFFLNLFVLTGSGRNETSLLDLQVGPPTQPLIDVGSLNPEPNGLAAYAAGSTQESQIAELQKQIDGLKQHPASLLDQIAELQKQVESLQVIPPPRQFAASRYGSFYDTTTQLATVIDTATAVTFNTTDLSNGVFLSTTSRVMVDTAGVYNFDTSFQLDKTSGGTGVFNFWFRLNGVNVPDSASRIRIQSNNAEIFSSLNYFFDLAAGDYVELVFSVSDLSVELKSFAAAAPHPSVPAIILTVANNIGGFQ
jgi:hypothetical protein